MKTIIEYQLGSELINALDELGKSDTETLFIHLHGQKFAVLREEDYRGWKETAYLLSSSKNAEILHQALNEPLDECKDLTDILNELDD